MAFLARIVVNAVVLWLCTVLVEGVVLEGGSATARIVTLLVVALIFGILNAVLRPVLKLLTLPLFLLTLGLFTFVLNAVMLLLTSYVAGLFDLPFRVDGFEAALFAAIIVSLVSFVANLILPD
jgi:putative membrane protein